MSLSENTGDFSTEGETVETQEQLGRRSREKDYPDDAQVFYSSTGGKQIGFNTDDIELLREGFEIAFQELGMEEDDKIINWGAPEGTPHMSRWCIEEATGFTQGTINSSVADEPEDYMEQAEEATVAISMPRTFKSMGERIQGQHGDLQEIFPELRSCLFAGDVATDSLRDWVSDNYGVELRGAYFGTEPGAVAVEVEPDVYKPTNPNMILEILEEDAEVGKNGELQEEDVHDLNVLDEGEEVTGPILFSAPLREELSFTRYRGGDVWTAWGTEEGPRMTFEGREDNVILYSGANVMPREIDDAVRSIKDTDWKAVASEEDDYVKLNFYLTDYIAPEELKQAIAEQNETVEAWSPTGTMQLSTETYNPESWEELESKLDEKYDLPRDGDGDIELLNDLRGKTPKWQRIAKDSSYTAG